MAKGGGVKILKDCTRPLKAKQLNKSFHFDYDPVTEHYILEIQDTDSVFPLFLKTPVTGVYEIVLTSNNKLSMRK